VYENISALFAFMNLLYVAALLLASKHAEKNHRKHKSAPIVIGAGEVK
jgi:hypothetical protein